MVLLVFMVVLVLCLCAIIGLPIFITYKENAQTVDKDRLTQLKRDLLTVTRQRDSLEAVLYGIRANPETAELQVQIALDDLQASKYKQLEK